MTTNLEELYKQKNEIQEQIRKIEYEEKKQRLIEAKNLVGKCIKSYDGKYIFITGIGSDYYFSGIVFSDEYLRYDDAALNIYEIYKEISISEYMLALDRFLINLKKQFKGSRKYTIDF